MSDSQVYNTESTFWSLSSQEDRNTCPACDNNLARLVIPGEFMPITGCLNCSNVRDREDSTEFSKYKPEQVMEMYERAVSEDPKLMKPVMDKVMEIIGKILPYHGFTRKYGYSLIPEHKDELLSAIGQMLKKEIKNEKMSDICRIVQFDSDRV